MKSRLKYVFCYTMTAFGIGMMMLFLYYIIGKPEDLTSYEQMATFVISVFSTERLYRKGGV